MEEGEGGRTEEIVCTAQHNKASSIIFRTEGVELSVGEVLSTHLRSLFRFSVGVFPFFKNQQTI